ncbi:PREDICTED: multidrug resistance protein 1B [Nicrophorus vespilloides]|uniref:Multidrug resistance protein 1B n=1 Tax=Nicrophorus vespilloides TaxID=110193 RepID=A0ABM1MSQ3_NICVS|nr:PREDICTED: multidrug resistance protein 1B [Nicrophorus vespilloides]
MKKKIELETMPKKKNKVQDALDAEFVKPDEKKNDKKEEVEFPPIGFFKLFRYTTGLDKFLLSLATLFICGTAACQPLNMLVFGTLSQNMIDFATALVPCNPEFDPECDPTLYPSKVYEATEKLKDDIQEFAIYNSLIGLAMLVLSYLSTAIYNYCGIRQSFKIRTLYLENVLNQDIGWYDMHQSGDFASRMADDLTKLEDGLGEKVAMFLHFQLSFIASLIQALVKGWKLALICLISLPVTMISMGIVAFLTSRLAKNELDAYGTAGAIAEEVFSTIRTVLAFGGHKKESERYEKELIYARDNNIKRSFLTGIGFAILWFCIYGSYALAFYFGVQFVLDERGMDDKTYTPGNMVVVFFSVMTGSMNFGMSSTYIEVFGIAKGAAAKIFGVIDHKPTINASKNNGEKPTTVIGDIKFENVTFHYPSRPEVPILNGLNLTIKPGETVALVGSSGCGKSTCIQLLQRFYDPLGGSVYLDNKNLKDLDLTWLRNNIGVVGQEPVLFGTSIAENIRFSYKEATQEDIEKAAKKANAHKFISSLPQGYETLVGERGAQLSGGQKQRIAIARALVREPAILLLDEATSALDTNSEAKVQAALDNVSKECTTIIVAHRLSTIRGASRIVVINKGVMIEEGTHEDLMEKKGEYYNLVTTQVTTVNDDDTSKVNLLEEDEDDVPTSNEKKPVDIETEEEEFMKKVTWMEILNLNSTEWPQITIGVIASVLMGCAMPIFAVLFGDIIGILSEEDEDYVESETNLYCIYFVIAGIVAGLATFFQIYTFGIAGEKLVMRVRSDMFKTVLHQEIGWFDRKENGVGALCAKLSSEASSIQGATGQRIGTIFQSIATFVLSIGLSMYYEWRLGLLALAFAPIILAAVFLQQRAMFTENTDFRKSLETSTKSAVEAVGNIRTVVSLGCEETFHVIYVNQLLPYTTRAKKNLHFRAFVLGLARSIMFFAFAACMYYGGYLMREEQMDFTKVLKVSQSLIMGTVSIANALAFTPNFQKGLQSAAKVLNLLRREPVIKNASNALDFQWSKGNINYSKIFFSYPTRPDTEVLKGLDLSIMNGKTVALVGSSGCGKSTIIQLIERYYDPSSGVVSVDNQDLKMITLESLRSNLGIVSQEPNLFDRTISENIAYGDNSREVGQEEIIKAAKNANIHNFISSLPLGYDTPLGDKGTQLSGGQKQRVAIARALVRNPRVLLLDEATSALDTESEKVVQEALDNAKQGRTCITIAHRLTTIQDADVICVINAGLVHEMGTHAELLQKKGIYHKLHSLQSGTKH